MISASFIGASCTAQTKNHQTGEVTGYVEIIRSLYAEKLGLGNVYQHTYPGNRFSGPGIFKIVEAIEAGVNVCVLELLIEDYSRGRNSSPDEYMQAFKILVDNGVLPILLFLPKGGIEPAEAWRPFSTLSELARKHGIPIIEIPPATKGAADNEKMFNGPNHTNYGGALYYAEKIYDQLIYTLSDIKKTLNGIAMEGIGDVICSKAGEIPSINQAQNIEIYIQMACKEKADVLICQLHKIGPYSPVLKVSVLSEQKELYNDKFSLWDEFCHYERYSYLDIKVPVWPGSNIIKLSVTDETPRYERSRREFDFSDYNSTEKRILIPMRELLISSKVSFKASVKYS